MCAYTESNTSSDLPPYVSVILQATATATEYLNYEVTVKGIKMEHGKDSMVIVIYKSRTECGKLSYNIFKSCILSV